VDREAHFKKKKDMGYLF